MKAVYIESVLNEPDKMTGQDRAGSSGQGKEASSKVKS